MIRSFVALILLLTCILLISSSCADGKDGSFEIYLTGEDVTPLQMEGLNHIDLADQPIISTGVVITFDAQTHEIKLNDDAFERICQLYVPIGVYFVVCVDNTPIYCGAFWSTFSSIPFEGVTILKPILTQESNVIVIDLGYPSPSYFAGEDSRNDPEVIKSLDKAGVLINKL